MLNLLEFKANNKVDSLLQGPESFVFVVLYLLILQIHCDSSQNFSLKWLYVFVFLLCTDRTNWSAGDKAGSGWGQHLWRLGDLELAIIRRLVPEWGLFYGFGILKYWLIIVCQSHELHSNACILHRRLDSQCWPLSMWTRGTLLTLPTEDCFRFIRGETTHIRKWWFRHRVWWPLHFS